MPLCLDRRRGQGGGSMYIYILLDCSFSFADYVPTAPLASTSPVLGWQGYSVCVEAARPDCFSSVANELNERF